MHFNTIYLVSQLSLPIDNLNRQLAVQFLPRDPTCRLDRYAPQVPYLFRRIAVDRSLASTRNVYDYSAS